jgi:hypothetical protein
MKKDVQEAIQFAMNNILLFADKTNELVDKVAELEDNLAFYANSINQLEMTVKKLSDNFHGTQAIDPYIINVSNEAYNHLVEELDKPAKKNKGLSRLFAANGDEYINKLDVIILEKKIREAIIEKLERQAEDNSCDCGDICQAYDNGFQDAINFIRNM